MTVHAGASLHALAAAIARLVPYMIRVFRLVALEFLAANRFQHGSRETANMRSHKSRACQRPGPRLAPMIGLWIECRSIEIEYRTRNKE